MKLSLWRYPRSSGKDGVDYICTIIAAESPDGTFHTVLDDKARLLLIHELTATVQEVTGGDNDSEDCQEGRAN